MRRNALLSADPGVEEREILERRCHKRGSEGLLCPRYYPEDIVFCVQLRIPT